MVVIESVCILITHTICEHNLTAPVLNVNIPSPPCWWMSLPSAQCCIKRSHGISLFYWTSLINPIYSNWQPRFGMAEDSVVGVKRYLTCCSLAMDIDYDTGWQHWFLSAPGTLALMLVVSIYPYLESGVLESTARLNIRHHTGSQGSKTTDFRLGLLVLV